MLVLCQTCFCQLPSLHTSQHGATVGHTLRWLPGVGKEPQPPSRNATRRKRGRQWAIPYQKMGIRGEGRQWLAIAVGLPTSPTPPNTRPLVAQRRVVCREWGKGAPISSADATRGDVGDSGRGPADHPEWLSPLVIHPLKLDNGNTVLTEGKSWRGEQRNTICRLSTGSRSSRWITAACGVAAQAFYMNRIAASEGLRLGAEIGLGIALLFCLVLLPLAFLTVRRPSL